MSKKHHGGPAPVPAGNRPGHGPAGTPGHDPDAEQQHTGGGAPFQEQDPQRRLGDFTGTGEHSIQQPGPLNDGDKHSK